MINPIICPELVYEFRAPRTNRQGTLSGYFDHPDRLYDAAWVVDGTVPACYITLNPVNPALLARANNRIVPHAKTTTSDADILRRDWLLIDCDAVRPANISSTDAEHQAALERCDTITKYLCAQGWPEPVCADSGNGGHLLFRIELPNDLASRDLIKAVLEVLALKFNDQHVVIDITVHNAARITKLYGTWACKGDSIPDRPHRRSAIRCVPDPLRLVPTSVLQTLAARRPADPKPNYTRTNGAFDIQAFINRHGLTIAREKPWMNGATVFELETCPFNAEHQRDSSIIQFASGALAFQCFHNSCQAFHWPELRDRLEPMRARPSGPASPDTDSREETLPDGPELIRLSDVAPELIRWLWRGRVAFGKLNLLIGDPGLGKSYMTIDMAARVSTGRAWPDGAPCVQGNIVVLSAEDGIADTIRPRIDQLHGDPSKVFVLKAIRQRGQSRPFCLGKDFPTLEQVIRDTQAIAVSIDPLSAYLGQTDSSVDSEVRGLLTPLAALADRTGAAVLAIMHMTKNAQVKAIYRAPGSIGFIGAARMALAVVQDPADEGRRILAPIKVNICNPPPMLGFRIRADGLFWDTEPVEHINVDAILRSSNAPDRSTQAAEVCDWLRGTLPQPADSVNRRARDRGFTDAMLRRACETLGVIKTKVGFNEGWIWSLPEDGDSRLRPDTPPNPLKNAKAHEGVPTGQTHAFEDVTSHSEGVPAERNNAFATSSDISTTYNNNTHEGVESQRRERIVPSPHTHDAADESEDVDLVD